jgi:hypothetical protein
LLSFNAARDFLKTCMEKVIGSEKIKAVGFITLVCCLFCPGDSLGATPYEEGVKLYGQKNYRAAAAIFEKVLSASNNNVNAIYYCALSQQMSNNLGRARQLYGYIVSNYANSSVAPMATRALSQLNKAPLTSAAPASASSSDSTGSAQGADSQQSAVVERAKAECNQIMKKAEQQIEDEKASSQTVYIYSDGHSGTDISSERRKEILNEAQERCKKIMDNAERTARFASTSVAPSTNNLTTRQSQTRAKTSVPRDGSDLIVITRNQGDRPPVSITMIRQVKSALESFPPLFLDLLRANSAKVHITPTMIDHNPDLKNTRPRGYEEGMTYKNCPAMFDSDNIVVAEYALIGDNDSAWEKMEDPIGSMRHEMGHALDQFLGRLTQTEEFKHVYYLDLGRLDPPTKERLGYYTQKASGGPSEAFAEVFAGMYGGRSMKDRQARTEEVLKSFPGLAALIKKKIAEIKPAHE